MHGSALRLRKTMNLAVAAIAVATLAATAIFAGGEAAPGLERFKRLAGEWVGPEGSGIEVTYRVTAGGSAVVETLFPGTEHEMVTVYHLDGTDLVLTHYCAEGNQPRRRAVASSDPGHVRFAFTGGSNIKSKRDGHMHEVEFTFVDETHLRSQWTYFKKGRMSESKTFELVRKS